MSATKEINHNEIGKGITTADAGKNDYPMLFDTQMVKAILSGEKTQTTRAFKSPLSKFVEPAKKIFSVNGGWVAKFEKPKLICKPIICPYGKVGDLLWVKETWAPAMGEIAYKADYTKDVLAEQRNAGLWKPSIHMPKTAARIWLEITDIKAQRIQSISEEDAKQEGCGVAKIYGFSETGQSNFREGFFSKWISIYGIESYYENPWTWVIKFKQA